MWASLKIIHQRMILRKDKGNVAIVETIWIYDGKTADDGKNKLALPNFYL